MKARNPEPEVPANTDAERVLLGAVLLDNAAYEQTTVLEACDFSLESHSRIYLRMGELLDRDEAVDIVTLVEELRHLKELESIGGAAYLCSLTEGLPRRPSVKDYVRIVKAKSLLRQLIGVCSSAIEKAYNGESGFDTISTLREHLDEIESSARRGVRKI